MSGHPTQLRSILSLGFFAIFATAAAFFLVDKGTQAAQEIEFLNNSPLAVQRAALTKELDEMGGSTASSTIEKNPL